MSKFSKGLGMILLLGGVPGTALGQGARQIQQEERLVNVLLGTNQLRINHQDNTIARQNTLVAELPTETRAQQVRTIAQIDSLNIKLEAAKGRLIGGLDKTEVALNRLDQATPSDPFVEAQLQRYLQRADLIFSTELQEADSIINRPPASPFSFSTAVDPLGLGRKTTAREAAQNRAVALAESRAEAAAAARAAAAERAAARAEAAAARAAAAERAAALAKSRAAAAAAERAANVRRDTR